MHSQRCREKPVQPWIIAEKSGKVLCSHCTCMAGLGEVCSHVGALLFCVESCVRIRDSSTVTQEKAYWMMPAETTSIDYMPIKDIDFTSASASKQRLDVNISNLSGPSPLCNKMPKLPRTLKENNIQPPTTEEWSTFLHSLSQCNTKPAILSLISPYSENYIPKATKPEFPQSMSCLYNSTLNKEGFHTILDKCRQVKLSITKDQIDNVEKSTQNQACNNLWFTFRTGRITASKFKQCCHTDPGYPSESLINSICYPNAYRFSTAATKWGCTHEKSARDVYIKSVQQQHLNFQVRDSGLVLNETFPFMGASPDGIIECDCCLKGCLEVKCPFCKKDQYLSDAVESKFCLELNQNNMLSLKKDHAYYYQVQCQMAICEHEYCDFVVWTKKDVHIERIIRDIEFFERNVQKAEAFFISGVLPELLAKYYSRPPLLPVKDASFVASSHSKEDDDFEIWCFCKRAIDTELIGCDNENCSTQWFHFECVGVKSKPRGKWYCQECRKFPQFKRGSKKSK